MAKKTESTFVLLSNEVVKIPKNVGSSVEKQIIRISENIEADDGEQQSTPLEFAYADNWSYLQSDVLDVFFNYIPTINWALAKPFINFRAIGPSVVSLDKLVFDDIVNLNGPSSYGATSADFKSGAWEGIGIEAYTMPVTLNNTNKAFAARGNYYNKFKPIFSIKDMTVKIVQAPGAVAFSEEISLNLYIHDKSKLRELTALFNPQYGTYFIIEYGWNHPEINNENISDFPIDVYDYGFNGTTNKVEKKDIKFKSVASFLNGLKKSSVFILENFDISLDETGTTTANLSLVSIAGNVFSAETGLINVNFQKSLSEYVLYRKRLTRMASRYENNPQLFGRKKIVKRLRDSISILNGEDAYGVDRRKVKEPLQVRGSAKAEVEKRINKLFSAKENEKRLASFRKLGETTDKIYSEKLLVPNVISKGAKKKFKGFSSVNITSESSGNDYSYLSYALSSLFKFVENDIKNVVRGADVGLHGKVVKDLNIVYFTFNNYCGNMSGKNIGSFVIDKKKFVDAIFEVVSSKPSYNINFNDMKNIFKNMVSNKKNINYGLQKFYDHITDKPVDNPNLQEQYNGFIKQSGGQFIVPKIRFLLRSTKTTIKKEETVKHFLFIYDEANFESSESSFNTKQFEDLMDGTIRGQVSGDVEKYNLEVTKRKIRDEIKMPYVIPGTERSPIKKIGAKTETNDLMGAIYLEQNTDPNPIITNRLVNQLDELPIDYVPMELSMDMAGYPLLEPQKKMFIDFKTGTNIDSIYSVGEITHKISADNFTTNCTLYPLQSYLKYRTAADIRSEFIDLTEESVTRAPSVSDGYDLDAAEKIYERYRDVAWSLINQDFIRLFIMRYYAKTIERETYRSKRNRKKILVNNKLEWSHGIGDTSIFEFYKLMALAELDYFKLRMHEKLYYEKLIEPKSFTYILPDDINRNMKSIRDSLDSLGFLSESSFFYSWFLTNINNDSKGKKVNISDLEREYKTLLFGEGDDDKGVFDILGVENKYPFIGSFTNNKAYPPNNIDPKALWKYSDKKLDRVLSYYQWTENFDVKLKPNQINKALFAGGAPGQFKLNDALFDKEINNAFLNDELSFIALATKKDVEIESLNVGFDKLKEKYERKMLRLAQLQDVFAPFAPDQIKEKSTLSSRKYFARVLIKSGQQTGFAPIDVDVKGTNRGNAANRAKTNEKVLGVINKNKKLISSIEVWLYNKKEDRASSKDPNSKKVFKV
jgi:hypothetical protein